VPPQFTSGDGQAHLALWQVIPPEQTVVQSPQWLSSESSLAQVPEHSIVSFGQPLAQA
jgi:hypothetical protein